MFENNQLRHRCIVAQAFASLPGRSVAGTILGGKEVMKKALYDLAAIEGVKEFMISRDHTIATAESVTSGHIQAALSLAAEASRFFQGGMTAYNLSQKTRHLHVDPLHAMTCNSVSPAVADEMALNALTLFSSDWALSITGYASPVPELGVKDLFAFYAIAFQQEVVCRGKVDSEDHGPLHVQVFFANHVIREFNRYLLQCGMAADRDGDSVSR